MARQTTGGDEEFDRALPAVHGAGRDSVREWAQELVSRARSGGGDLTGDQGLLTSMVKEVLQAGLDVELTEHLGYERYSDGGAPKSEQPMVATQRPLTAGSDRTGFC